MLFWKEELRLWPDCDSVVQTHMVKAWCVMQEGCEGARCRFCSFVLSHCPEASCTQMSFAIPQQPRKRHPECDRDLGTLLHGAATVAVAWSLILMKQATNR